MAGLTKEDVKEAVRDATQPIAIQVNGLHKAYFGNGNPGIKTEVAVLKTRVRIIWAGLGIIVLAVVALAGRLLFSHLGG